MKDPFSHIPRAFISSLCPQPSIFHKFFLRRTLTFPTLLACASTSPHYENVSRVCLEIRCTYTCPRAPCPRAVSHDWPSLNAQAASSRYPCIDFSRSSIARHFHALGSSLCECVRINLFAKALFRTEFYIQTYFPARSTESGAVPKRVIQRELNYRIY